MTTHGSLANIEKLESDLWEAADNLRANSKLALQNQKLRTARDLLLPKLMSGEIEV